MGVPAKHIEWLGKIVVAAGRLESTAHDCAKALLVEKPSKMQIPAVGKAIHDRLKAAGVPAYARATEQDVTVWVDRMRGVFKERDEILHSVMFRRAESGEWEPARLYPRGRAVTPVTDADLERVATRLKKVYDDGRQLSLSLMREVRQGVYIRRPEYLGEPWIIHSYLVEEQRYPDRATDEEADGWWATYSKLDWGPKPAGW